MNNKEKNNLIQRIKNSEMFYNYKKKPSAIIGTIIITISLFFAIFGPAIAPYNPYDLGSLELADAYKPPVWEVGGSMKYFLGTDSQGRDLYSSLIYGSRISMYIGIVGMVFSCLLGTTLGLTSGYYGGKWESIVMRFADILLSFPSMLLALFIMAIAGRGVGKMLIVFTLLGSVNYIRTVRAEVLSVKNMEYIDASRVIGISNKSIMIKHILPNVATTIIVISTMRVGGLILAEATLSFLGVGVPVTEPSLGLLVKNGFNVLFSGYWWLSILPGLYIMFIVFGINLLGDFLRDELNPRLK